MITIDTHRKTKDGKVIQGCSHTSIILNHKERNAIVMKAVADLRKLSFDSIVCSGTSGLLVVPQIAEILDKHIIVVRKPSEKRYSIFEIEGVTPHHYIIVDDLICSGSTIKLIKKTLHNECPRSICVGAYFYMPHECAYVGEDGSKLFLREYGIPALNPFPQRT
jgi:adenine/guanine phosphoribosyltransferase-like PRPP-binding protein